MKRKCSQRRQLHASPKQQIKSSLDQIFLTSQKGSISCIPQEGQYTPVLASLCSKIQRLIQKQNLNSIQPKLAYEFLEKFDRLIDYTSKIYDSLQKVLQRVQRLQADKKPCNFSLIDETPINYNKNELDGSFSKFIVHKVEEDNGEQNKNSSLAIPNQQDMQIEPCSPLRNKLSFESKVQQEYQQHLPKSLLDLTQVLLLSQTESDVLSVLSKSVGTFFNRSASYYFNEFNIGRLGYLDMKIRFSEDIVHNLINLARQWFNLYKKIPDQKRKLIVNKKGCVYKLHGIASLESLRFLIAKYPPSRKKKIDTELSEKIQEMDVSTKVQYEMLRNAKMEIGVEAGQTDFSKDIKKWLNKLIIQSKRQYPGFKQVMKLIFLGRQSSIDGEGKMDGVEYQIGVKIPEEVQLYTHEEIEAPGLDIKNPALLRILMKWCEQLISYFTNSRAKITSNQFGFKPVSPQFPIIKIPYSRMQQLAEKLKNIEQSYLSIRKAEEIQNIGVLINDLITLSLDGVKGYQFLDSTQITIIKLSQYLSESLKSYLFIFLNMVLTKLVDVRKEYCYPRSQATIQLINFNVMDLLRCKCSGTKSQIYRIYNQIAKHNDYFEIIRVKNKLNESTRDILINLKLKNSFLICEVQLSLGQNPEQINSQFCHYLYELERSSFGIIFQCASQICNLDPRIQYVKKEKNLVFKRDNMKKQLLCKMLTINSQDNDIYCSFSHSETKMQKVENSRPYCCRYCTSFIPAYRICLEYFRCPTCFIALCPKCVIVIAGENKRFINKYISSKSDNSELQQFIEPSDICSGIWNFQNLEMNVMNLLDKYQFLIHILIDNMGCRYNIYKRYKDSFTEVFSTLPQIGEQIPLITEPCFHTLQPLKKVQVKSLLSLTKYRKLHFKLSWMQLQQILKQSDVDSILCIVQQQLKIVMVVDIIQSQQKIQSYKLNKQCHKIVKQYNKDKQNGQIEMTSKKLKDIGFLRDVEDPQSVVTLNLWQNQIEDISPLKKFIKVKQLYLRQNIIKSIDPILKMHDLQIASLSHNNLKGFLPVLAMPHLSYLLINDTNIDNIQNINHSNLQKLTTLRAQNINITNLPTLKNLLSLKIIKFDNCKIESLDNFCKSHLPSLQRIYIQHNHIQGHLPKFIFKQLKIMKIGYNKIESVDEFALSDCSHLQKLFLGDNRIRGKLPKMGFCSLNRLNLENNQIDELEDMDTSQYPALEVLDIQSNVINKLSRMTLKNLVKLNLFNNKIRNIQILEQYKLPCLEQLDLSHNQIEGSLPILKFYSLKSLNLSDNRIQNISRLGILKLPKVSSIKLNNNLIESPIPILDLQRLTTLDLSKNKIRQEKFIDHIYLIPVIQKIILSQNTEELKNAIMEKAKLDLMDKLQL